VSSLRAVFARVGAGDVVTLRPRGQSMRGMIEDRDEVCVAPVDASLVEPGDVVLVKVSGRVYLHKVLAAEQHRVQIGNNRGGTNGWTPRRQVVGIVVSVNGTPRPRVGPKVRNDDDGDRERPPSSIS
jgi:hypothetical protein